MTVPVNDRQPWQQLPLNRLLVYRDGIRVYEGTDHQKEFFEEMGTPYIEALLKKIGKNKRQTRDMSVSAFVFMVSGICCVHRRAQTTYISIIR